MINTENTSKNSTSLLELGPSGPAYISFPPRFMNKSWRNTTNKN